MIRPRDNLIRNPTKTKICNRCHKEKVASEFYKHGKTSLRGWCKYCNRPEAIKKCAECDNSVRNGNKTCSPECKKVYVARKYIEKNQPICTRCKRPKTLEDYLNGSKHGHLCSECRSLVDNELNRKREFPKTNHALIARMREEAPDGQRWCSGFCQKYLPLHEFWRDVNQCSTCTNYKAWVNTLKKTFGITDFEYFNILEAQGTVCAICKKPPFNKRLAVDHSHNSGIIRGLLCFPCNNRVLASARDDSQLLRRAAEYIDNPPAVEVIGERVASSEINK